MTETENDPDNLDAGDAKAEDEALVVDNGSGMAVAEDAEPEAVADEAPAEKPKPKRRAKAKPKAAAAEASAEDDAEPAAEAKPKRARRKSAAAKAKADDAADATADAPAEERPKARRTRRKAEPEKSAPRTRSPKGSQGTGKKPPAHDYGDNPPMVRAHAKYVRTSARKARLVCDHIRGKSVEEARAILAHANRDVARDWSKLLESAVANAEHNHELIGDELRIAAVKADEGPTLKRFRPRAMGRATKIRKRTSHLSITLTPKDGDR
jgi:ribosomal protein L22